MSLEYGIRTGESNERAGTAGLILVGPTMSEGYG
jgi:hypothetical protein